MKRNKNFSGPDSDDDYMADEQTLGRSNGARTARRTAVAQTPRSAGRSRPTNNQLLYKAYFRWTHYGHKLRSGTTHLPTETDACPSVTAAFLQVLHTLNLAEGLKVSEQRNILQILSNNTRRTKVVELSTGTHRVPDELRKHYLSDGEGGQYSTNLDRNRYGNDDQYLFTVVRYDLEFLGLCPCMVDVEIIDAKNDNQSIFVSAGQEACICSKFPGMLHDPGYAMQQFASRSRGAMPAISGAVEVIPGVSPGQPVSPKRSGSQVSLAFDALVMAATGGTEGAAAAAAGGEAPVESRLGGPLPPAAALTPALTPGSSSISVGAAAAAAAAAMAASVGRSGGTGVHQLPSRQRSRLWSALSYGDVDSLQNALDAFRAEDEIASGPGLSDALAQAGAAAAAAPQPSTSETYRRRQRKPIRGPSSNNILAQSVDMLAGLSGVDRNVLSSLVKGTGVASGLPELSADNAAQADVISSGAVQDGTARRTSSGPGRSTGSQGARGAVSGGQPTQQQRISFRTSDPDEQMSQEDDSEPVTGNRSGGRKSGSEADAAAEGLEGLGAAAEAADDEGAVVGIADSMLPGAAGEGVGDAGEADMGEDDGDAPTAGMDGPPLNSLARRVRHVPRQSSAVNLGTRVGPAELKRMAAEVEVLKAENHMLRQAAGAAAAGLVVDEDIAAAAAVGGGGSRVMMLEREVAALRQQVGELLRSKRAADEKVLQLNQELIQTRNTANQVLHHALMKEASALSPAAATAAAAALGGLGRPGHGLAGGFGGLPPAAQGGLPAFNPALAALASGQLHTLLAGAHNPAATAALAAAMAAAAAATSNPVAGFDQQQQLIRSSGNLPEELGQYDEAEQEQQRHQQQLLHQQQQQQQMQQQSPGDAAAAMQAAAAAAATIAAAAAAAAGAPPVAQALGRDMVAESVAEAEVDQVPGSAAAAAAEADIAAHASPAAATAGVISDDIKAAADTGFKAEEDSKPSLTAAAAADLASAGLADVAAAADTAAVDVPMNQERPLVESAAGDTAGTAPSATAAAGDDDVADCDRSGRLHLDAAAAAAVLSMQQQLVSAGLPAVATAAALETGA